ncbi:MAG: glycosyltransferase family 4 protein [Nannocystaceae bacterium]
MRIALSVDFSPWSPYSGGAQKSTHQLASALSERGHDVSVFYTKSVRDEITPPVDLPYALRWVPLMALRTRQKVRLRPLTCFWMRPAVQRWLDEEPTKMAVVHSQGDEGAFFGNLRHRSGLAKVATLRHPLYPDARRSDTRTGRALAWVRTPKYGLQRWTALQADLCAPASEDSARLITAYYGVSSQRLRVIHNGIDDIFFSDGKVAQADPSTVVFAGRLEPSKGLETLLDAWARLGSTAPQLLVFGQGDDARYRKLVTRLRLSDKVTFRGWTQGANLANALRAATIAVVPSLHESFGNAVAEAMASETVVLATRVGSIPELVEHDRSGWLVEPQDAQALANAVRHLMGDLSLRRRLARDGKARAMAGFRWRHAAAAFEDLYVELLPGSP